MWKYLALAGVLGLAIPALATEPLTDRQLDQVTAGWSPADLSALAGSIGSNYTQTNNSTNQVSGTMPPFTNNNNGISGNQYNNR